MSTFHSVPSIFFFCYNILSSSVHLSPLYSYQLSSFHSFSPLFSSYFHPYSSSSLFIRFFLPCLPYLSPSFFLHPFASIFLPTFFLPLSPLLSCIHPPRPHNKSACVPPSCLDKNLKGIVWPGREEGGVGQQRDKVSSQSGAPPRSAALGDKALRGVLGSLHKTALILMCDGLMPPPLPTTCVATGEGVGEWERCGEGERK